MPFAPVCTVVCALATVLAQPGSARAAAAPCLAQAPAASQPSLADRLYALATRTRARWAPGPVGAAAAAALPADVTAVWTGRSYAYVVSAPQGPLWIDAGSDLQAEGLRQALAARGHTFADVSAVLLTHGHADHVAGLAKVPQAEIYVALADAKLARGDGGPKAWAYALAARLGPRPRDGRPQNFVLPGELLQLAGATFRVLPLPGHTEGSVGYAYGDGAFVGDAARPDGAGGLRALPWPSAAAPRQAADAAARLARLGPWRWLAGGHQGPQQL